MPKCDFNKIAEKYKKALGQLLKATFHRGVFFSYFY